MYGISTSGPIANEKVFYRLRDLIKDTKYAMLTSIDARGRLCGKPVAVIDIDSDDKLVFFVSAAQIFTDGPCDNEEVGVTFMSTTERRYVSVSGRAALIFDRRSMRKYWRPSLYSSFPLGLDDPDLALLTVRVENAEYWDSPNARVVYQLAFGSDYVVEDDVVTAVHNDRSDVAPRGYGGWLRERSGRLLVSLEHLFVSRGNRFH